MEDNKRIAQKIEVGPLRRLEVLARWMAAMDVDAALCHLLEESLEDLRDVLLHLKASPRGLTPVSEYRVAGWREVPDPTLRSGPLAPASDRKASLLTVEMEGRAAPRSLTAQLPASTGTDAEGVRQMALPPSLLQDNLDVPRVHLGRANKKQQVIPGLRKPLDEHRGKGRPGKSRADALRAALQEAKADHARALARARSMTENTSTRLLDAELDFLIEHTLSRLIAT